MGTLRMDPISEPVEHSGATTTEPRRRRGSPDDRALLDNAFKVFVEFGFEGASIDLIAARAGVAKRTLYLRHGDKEGLFRAALALAIENWIIPIDRLRAAETDDFAETLRMIGRMLLDNVMSSAGLNLLKLTNGVAARMPELGAYNVEKGFEPTLGFLEELIARRIEADLRWFSTARDAAMAFMNLVVTGPVTFVVQGVVLEPDFIDRYLAASIACYLEGIAPGTGSSKALMDENRRLKILLADALLEVHRLLDAST